METEEKLNGQDQTTVTRDLEALYPFDDMEPKIEIPHGGHLVVLTYRKPELSDYLERQKAAHTKTKVVDDWIMGTPVKHDADIDFFDLVALRATKRKADGLKIVREYSDEECRAFPYEFKVRAVKKITTWPFEVEVEGDDLAEQSTYKVTQTIGQFTVVYEVSAMPAAKRQSYENAVQSKSGMRGGYLQIETEVHQIEKAMRLFGGDSFGNGGHFISLEGGRLETGPFTPDRRLEFVSQIDPMMQVGVINAICDYHGGSQD